MRIKGVVIILVFDGEELEVSRCSKAEEKNLQIGLKFLVPKSHWYDVYLWLY